MSGFCLLSGVPILLDLTNFFNLTKTSEAGGFEEDPDIDSSGTSDEAEQLDRPPYKQKIDIQYKS